ncbi:multidrug efflux SMR transporter [Paraconexibacter sp.]|uniref:DMT family transporter n=1 Tax=Paraconexibacter sp. TaxID=2949640 RepID=UPI003565D3F1
MLLAWSALSLAIVSEIAATLSLKSAGDGSIPAALTVAIGYLLSFLLLLVVVRRIEVSIAYAVWAGAGTAVIALVGMTALGEPTSALKVASIGLVVVGVVGLNLAGAH